MYSRGTRGVLEADPTGEERDVADRARARRRNEDVMVHHERHLRIDERRYSCYTRYAMPLHTLNSAPNSVCACRCPHRPCRTHEGVRSLWMRKIYGGRAHTRETSREPRRGRICRRLFAKTLKVVRMSACIGIGNSCNRDQTGGHYVLQRFETRPRRFTRSSGRIRACMHAFTCMNAWM